MKCKDCKACCKGYFKSEPNKFVCIGVREPFIINNINRECTEYKELLDIKMDKVANSGNDEFYTPLYAVKPIVKYIPRSSKIWCPFDTDDSLFVKYFRELGYEVIATHIQNGVDFFKTDVPDCDYIISNPPYSVKGKVFERLFEIGKPFAMLVGVVGLFESQERFNMFKNHDFEIMYLNKRVAYFKDYGEQKPSLNPPFSSVYLCSHMLPKQIVFEEIEKSA